MPDEKLTIEEMLENGIITQETLDELSFGKDEEGDDEDGIQ